jgi:1-acyl-sn-glycerol-3-phosphate acyltransferase
MKVFTGILSLCYKLYVGAIFVTTLILFYPFFFIVLSRKCWRKHSFPLNIAWSYVVRVLTFIHPYKVHKTEVPEGPYMIIANHTSYFDIFLLYSLLPNHRFLFMGKSELLSYPLIKTYFKRLNIPVYRKDRLKAAKAFIQAKQAIAEGWSVVIFPEGGIPDKCPKMIPFKIGAFKLAKSAGVPIIPITFIDNYHLFSDPEEILGLAHPGISRVHLHPVISKEEVAATSEQELCDKTFDLISAPLIARGLMEKPEKPTSEAC